MITQSEQQKYSKCQSKLNPPLHIVGKQDLNVNNELRTTRLL